MCYNIITKLTEIKILIYLIENNSKAFTIREISNPITT